MHVYVIPLGFFGVSVLANLSSAKRGVPLRLWTAPEHAGEARPRGVWHANNPDFWASAEAAAAVEKEGFTIPPHSLVVFRGDLLHAGGAYDYANTRVHWYAAFREFYAACVGNDRVKDNSFRPAYE